MIPMVHILALGIVAGCFPSAPSVFLYTATESQANGFFWRPHSKDIAAVLYLRWCDAVAALPFAARTQDKITRRFFVEDLDD